MTVLSYIIMGVGLVFMLIGVVGIMLPGKDFYFRILVACKIDTVGLLTFAIGLAVRHGISFFTGKMMLIVVIVIILNPLVTHIVARAAYKSGYPLQEEEAMPLPEGSGSSTPEDKGS